GQRCHDAAAQVEKEIAAAPKYVLDIVAEDPKEKHVADQVKPAAVQEHAGQELRPCRYPLVGSRRTPKTEQLGGDHSVAVEDRTLVLAELPQERTNAQANQQGGD